MIQRFVNYCNELAVKHLLTKPVKESEIIMSDLAHNARKALKSAGQTFCSVTFVKKDGSIRTLNHRNDILHKFVSNTPESIARAAIKRANNPHLVTVIDMALFNKLPDDRKADAIRQFDANRLVNVKVKGRIIPFGRVVSHVLPL